ncbi:hypothetical protein BaRGS_00007720, partial [Batillaria attramentaria]
MPPVQLADSRFLAPKQNWPPLAGVGLSHDLVRCCWQSGEQGDQGDHSDHAPSTTTPTTPTSPTGQPSL